MPGIVGLATRMPRSWAEPQLVRMVESLQHESFYRTGTWIDESLGIYVGWIARPDAYPGEMPLRSAQDDLVVVFSGEEYSGVGYRGNVVRADGGSSGTRDLVGRYESEPNFPAGLNGRFHGFVLDRRRQTAILFNDRYGMHRIYCHEAANASYFAAEAKAILSVRPELRMLSARALGEFVACGCVLENRTLFEGIDVLPPASAWVVGGNGIERKRTYFRPDEWEDQETLEPAAYQEELQRVFTQILPRHFAGEDRIGVSLTGGLDSRMIMAWHKAPPGSLPCYSFGGSYRDCQDVVLARQVARACGQPHEVITVGNEFLSRFAHYAERSVYLTDGCTGAAHAADLYVNERARAIAPVRMTGNYGGEVLRRVRAFKAAAPLPGLYSPELADHIRRAEETYASLLDVHPLSFAVFRQAPWHHYGLLALEQTQLTLRSPFLDNDLVRTVYRAPASACADSRTSMRLIAAGDPALARIRTDRGLLGGRGRLATTLVHGLLEFTFKAEYAYGEGMPHWLARVDCVLEPLGPERLLLGRHKFAHYRIWYRHTLSCYLRETLLDPRALSRPYLQPNVVRQVVDAHCRGDRNYTSEIHQLLSLELLNRLFLDSAR